MLEVGSLVDGKYRILRVVGKGGMSVVYQAVNEKANKIWAIKEVRKDGVQDYEIVKQNLVDEIDILKRLNHPNLPSIIDVIDSGDSFLIVMDYIEGNSLSKALESGPQKQEDVIEWSKQLCDVLGYLHSRTPRPIIYRDMKPANVMLKPDGKVSLIDFGTAREFKSSAVEDTTCLGTRGYAAPEQYGGHGQTDPRTDIYCLGATMYHLVTGHNPSLYKMYPITQWNPLLSEALEAIILKCTQENPDDRYQNCAELLYDLDNLDVIEPRAKRLRELKWRTFIGCLIAMVVMLFGTIGFSVASSTTTSQTYASLIAEGDTLAGSVDDESKKQAESKYLKAITKIDPANVEAYSRLLELYMKDLVLKTDEFRKFRDLMASLEKNDSKNKSRFVDLVTDFANDIFFFYETKNSDESPGIPLSAIWYKKVVDSPFAEEKKKTFASDMFVVAENFSNVDQINGMRAQFPFTTYFTTLQNLLNADLKEEGNIHVALKAYQFIAAQTFIHMNDWADYNIYESSYWDVFQKIEEKTNYIVNKSTLYKKNEEKLKPIVNKIEEFIKSARAEGYGSQIRKGSGE